MGQKVAVQGTPTMFINGERVANPTDFDGLAKMVDAKLAK
jgi:protein-disulfide isomerase